MLMTELYTLRRHYPIKGYFPRATSFERYFAATTYNVTPSSWIPIRGILSSSSDAMVNITGVIWNLDYIVDTEELKNPIDIWNVNQIINIFI